MYPLSMSCTVRDLAEKARSIKPLVTANTHRSWVKAIRPIADMKVEDVDHQLVWSYADGQLPGLSQLSDGTLRQRIGTLSGIWNRAVKRRIITSNPWNKAGQDLKSARSHHPLRGWNFYKIYHGNPLFNLLYMHGFRIGEIAGILPDDVVLDAEIPYFNLIHYQAPYRRLKNDMSIRQVPIHPICLDLTRDLKARGKFPLSKDRNGPGKSWSESFRQKLQLPHGEGAHSLRHNFETRLRATNPNPACESRLLGHSLSMTGRYGHVLLEMLFETLCKVGR